MISAYNQTNPDRKNMVFAHIVMLAFLGCPEFLKYWSTLTRVVARNCDFVLLNFNGVLIKKVAATFITDLIYGKPCAEG